MFWIIFLLEHPAVSKFKLSEALGQLDPFNQSEDVNCKLRGA